MVYLTIDELTSHIPINILADIVEQDPTTFNSGSTSTILDDIESSSLSEVSLYVANYYDWDKLLSGSTRFEIFTSMVIDIFIFKLYQRVDIDNMPEGVLYNFEGVIKQLKDIAMRKLNPHNWPVLNNKYVSSTIDIYTSDIKINYQY